MNLKKNSTFHLKYYGANLLLGKEIFSIFYILVVRNTYSAT